jgi:hypothetical protein
MEMNKSDSDHSEARSFVTARPRGVTEKREECAINRVGGSTRSQISAMKKDYFAEEDITNELADSIYPNRNLKIKRSELVQEDSKKMYEKYRQLAIKTVSMNGLVLENYPGLCDDKDVVLAAVRQNADAFAFASKKLRDDEDVFIAATTKNWSANIFGSRRLRMGHGFLGNR